jgi:hypothetical protein
MIVCPKKEKDEWHANKCLYGQCKHCKINFFPFYPIDCGDYNFDMVDLKIFVMEPTMSRDGKPSKKLTFVYENINNEKLIEYSNQRSTRFCRA